MDVRGRGPEGDFFQKIRGADNRPRVPLQTFSPGGCSTSGHHGKGKLAFGPRIDFRSSPSSGRKRVHEFESGFDPTET